MEQVLNCGKDFKFLNCGLILTSKFQYCVSFNTVYLCHGRAGPWSIVTTVSTHTTLLHLTRS